MATGWLRGVVKEVPSGDQVVIVAGNALESVGGGAKAFPAEKRLTLGSVSAPRLGRRDGSTQDEAFAWASRENLRRRVAGKPVVFKVDYAVESIGREFGTVYVNESENAAYVQIAEGFARVKESRNASEASPYIEQFRQAEEGAKAKGLGMWNKSTDVQASAVRKVVTVGKDAGHSGQDLITRCAGSPTVAAVVDGVGNPHVLRVVIPEPSTSTHATVFVAGIACPLVSKRAAEGEAAPGPEPFAIKSKVMVESLVLNRDVRLKLEGLDKYGNLYVSVMTADASGNYTVSLAESLLKAGLARVVDWSTRMMAPLSASKLRTCEKAAKASKAAIWHNYVAPPESDNALSDVFTGVVCEVSSGDTLSVWLPKERQEKRVQLSSIRAPRLPSKGNNNQGEPYALEAKEFLRSRAIGKEVKVTMEYTRKIPIGAVTPGQEPTQFRVLSFGTVTTEEKTGGIKKAVNLAEMLLVRGLAATVKHRGDDERSGSYEELLEAEARGMKQRKGMHSGKTPAPPRTNDLSVNGTQAKSRQFLPFLQRSGRVHAVIDYVLSGHRMKVHIAKDSLSCVFALANVRSPGKGQPFSDEALQFARVHLMQRDVDIEVEDVDRAGAFIGNVYIAPRGVDFAPQIVAAGLCSVQGYALSEGSPLVKAQNKAMAAKLKIWENYEEEQAKKKAERAERDGAESAKKVESIKMRCTNIVSGNMFYAQRVDDATTALLGELEAMSVSDGGSGGAPHAKGDVVLCKFSGDGKLYRARIEAYDSKANTYEVFYVDFGNRETCQASAISSLALNLKTSSPLAFACKLAFVKSPSLEEDYGYESAELLHSLVGSGQILTAVVEDRYTDVVQGKRAETIAKVSVVDPATNANVAMEMIRGGLARVEKVRGRFRGGGGGGGASEATKALAEEEEQAKKNRTAMWQYGDIGSDDEEGGAWGRK